VNQIARREAEKLFGQVIGPNPRENIWLIQRVESTKAWWNPGQEGRSLFVQITFKHGILDNQSEGWVRLEYHRVQSGPTAKYECGGVDKIDYEGLAPVMWKTLWNRINEVYKGKDFSARAYDVKQLGENTERQVRAFGGIEIGGHRYEVLNLASNTP